MDAHTENHFFIYNIDSDFIRGMAVGEPESGAFPPASPGLFAVLTDELLVPVLERSPLRFYVDPLVLVNC